MELYVHLFGEFKGWHEADLQHYSDITSSLHSDDNSPLVCWNISSQDNPKTDNQISRPDYAYVKCQLNI